MCSDAPTVAMPEEIGAVFAGWPTEVADRLAAVRSIAFGVAAGDHRIGDLREYLAWGQPSLRPSRAGVGDAIRLGVSGDGTPAMFVHCATSLVSEFRAVAGHLAFEGQRAVLLPAAAELPEDELTMLIELAFTSRLRRTGKN